MVDRTSGVPMYRQVAQDIRAKIETGEYPPGDAIPSEADLLDIYDVSRPTLREAIRLLRGEGRLTAEHGRGVFVRAPAVTLRRPGAQRRLSRAAREADQGAFRADAAIGGFVPSSTVKISFEPADGRIAQLLDLSPGTEVTVRDRIMKADGRVTQLAVSRFPRELTSDSAIEEVDTGSGGVYARLEEGGHKLTRFEETVGARMPTQAERSALGLADGVPVITITRIAFTDNGPAEVNDIVLPGDSYQLVYEWPAD